MPAKKQTRTKTTSTANKGKKRTAASTGTTSKMGTRKPKAATARSASKPRKSQPSVSPSTELERRPLSPAGKIVAKATKVALTTQSRAKRWVERVQQAVAKATEIPDKVKNYRKQSKMNKENT